MSERKIPSKEFIINNASLEKFIEFKQTFGIKNKIKNYNVEIVKIDDNNFLRKVETDMGFTGFLREIVFKLIGTYSINAIENIYYDFNKKEYKCIINDPNEGKYKEYFSFKEEYSLIQEGTTLKGTLNVNIENKLPYLISGYVEKSFFSQRHNKLRDELIGSKLDPNDGLDVIESTPNLDKLKTIEEIQQEYSEQLEKEIEINHIDYNDFFNKTYYVDDDDIPIC